VQGWWRDGAPQPGRFGNAGVGDFRARLGGRQRAVSGDWRSPEASLCTAVWVRIFQRNANPSAETARSDLDVRALEVPGRLPGERDGMAVTPGPPSEWH